MMTFSRDGLLDVPPGTAATALADPGVTNLQKHKKAKEPLFQHTPVIGDVIQGQLGDCYLLAALSAILSMPDGPMIILHTMRDNGDGTVTLRLYKAGAYHFLRIDKSVVHEAKARFLGRRVGTGRTLHGEGALWVSLMEKACLAFIRSAKATGYEGLESGHGSETFEAIMGPGPDLSKKVAKRETGLDPALDAFEAAQGIWAVLVNQVSAKNARWGQRYADDCELVASTVFRDLDDTDTHVRRWAAWNVGEAQRGMQHIMPSEMMADTFDNVYRATIGGLDSQTAEIVRIWVHAAKLLAGAVGTGLYTAPQRDRFARIQRYLATRRPLTVTSPKVIPGLESGKGHSAGESKVEGLVGEHVYSIAGTRTDPVGRKFVLLRNPWGSYGRAYQTETRTKGAAGAAPLKPVAVEAQAESWIEFTDYCRSFQKQESVGAQAHGEARQKLFTNLDQQLQSQRAQLKPLKKP
jgi:hypothetical protein